jgi:hypothetical protein
MVVVFLLKLVEMAIPRLVRYPCVPSVDAVIIGAEVAYFLAARCKPSVEEGSVIASVNSWLAAVAAVSAATLPFGDGVPGV